MRNFRHAGHERQRTVKSQLRLTQSSSNKDTPEDLQRTGLCSRGGVERKRCWCYEAMKLRVAPLGREGQGIDKNWSNCSRR